MTARLCHRDLVVWLGVVAFVAVASAALATDTPTPTHTPTPSATSPTATATFARTPPLEDSEVSGSYRGSWATGSAAGALTLTFANDSAALTGTAVFEDHPCLGLGRFVGRVSGNVVNGTLSSVTSMAMGNSHLTASPTGLSGTFAFVAGCAESAIGTITVFRAGPATPRGTASATPILPAITATPTRTATATATPAALGDCDGDGTVTVEELVAMVSIGLSTRPLPSCRAADGNGDGSVTVDEILRGVFAALSGVTATALPPPVVQRCLDLGTAECVCRGEVCCVSGECGLGSPCGDSADCRLGLRCAAAEGGAVCVENGTIVVPPPR